MSDNVQKQFSDKLNHIYATLNQQDVEQFYAGYQLWWIQQRIASLQEQIGHMRLQISDNAYRLQQVQPPAVAFATLARLQANGVNDTDLLDRMLERGEEWLDLTMQRLDYCEQLDFIHDNYVQWCEHALEGAYDWIDSMRDASADTTPRPVVTTEDVQTNIEATEELLLRKLTSEEEEEEETSATEITLKQPAISLAPTTKEAEPESTPNETVEDRVIVSVEELIPAPTADTQQGSSLQEAEMALPVEDEFGTSFISAEQTDENESVKLAPALEAISKEAGLPQNSEMSHSIEQGSQPDLSLVSREQANEDEYIEFAPPILQETFPDVEELSTTQKALLSSEIDGEEIPSPVVAEQTDQYREFSPHLLPTDATTWTDAPLTFVMQEEPKPSNDGATHTQTTINDYRKLPPPVQEEKPQRRYSLWRRLLAFLWP